MPNLKSNSIVDIKNPWLRKPLVIWAYVIAGLIFTISVPFIFAISFLWPALQEAGQDIKQGYAELHLLMVTSWIGNGKV